MQISCKGWNPSKQEVRCQARCLALEYCKEPFDATDHAIDSVIEALRADGCEPDIITTITLPLDEYRLLISDAQRKAKEEGREETWYLARRIVTTHGPDCYTGSDFDSAFGSHNADTIFGMPADEALAKDKKYQEEKEALHVGDEVEFTAPGPHKFIEVYKGYVIRFDEESPRWVSILTKDGLYHRSPLMCTKTGKHNPDIEKVMASFEKGEN